MAVKKDVDLRIKVSKEFKAEIFKLCEKEDINLSEYVRNLIKKDMKERGLK